MKAHTNYKRTNKKTGQRYMLVCGHSNNALVYCWCENEKSGRTHSRWCYCQPRRGMSPVEIANMMRDGLPLDEAVKMFSKLAAVAVVIE